MEKAECAKLNIGKNFKPKSEQVYEAIMALILERKLLPGEKQSETEISNLFGVSRTPVREALRKLDAEGFVNLTPNSGFEIAAFSKKDALEVLEIRRLLEGEAAKKVAEMKNIEKNRLTEAISHAEDYQKFGGVEKEREFMKIDLEFHRTIFEIARNRKMLEVSSSLSDRQFRLFVAHSTDDESCRICIQQHQGIYNAIMDYNGYLAEKLAKDHIDFIANMIKQSAE